MGKKWNHDGTSAGVVTELIHTAWLGTEKF